MQEEEFSGSFNPDVWKRLARFLIPYRKRLLHSLVFMILTGFFDTAYTLLQRYAIDHFIETGNMAGIVPYMIVFAVIIAIQALNSYIVIALANDLMISVSYDLRKTGFDHLQKLSFSYYDKTQVGWIVSRITGDTYNLAGVLAWGLVDIIWEITLIFFVVGIMLILNWRLALLAIGVLPLLAFATVFFQKKILVWNREVRKNNSRLTGAINEGIMGAKTTKILATEEKTEADFEEHAGRLSSSTVKAALYSSLFLPVVMTLGSVGTALILQFGGQGAISGIDTFAGFVTTGTLSAFLIYSVQIFEPLREIARIIADIISTQASGERLIALFDSEVDVTDSDEVVAVYGDEYEPKKENWPELLGEIELENVTYAYRTEASSHKVLDGFSLKIEQGQSIAFVGETGAGKSTIMNLICRFYEPQEGRVLIDGVDVKERSQLWIQSRLGYVLQDPHLFSGTIRENIRYGRLEAADREVEDAAKRVSVHEAIMALPDGYDTEVEEGGARLSQGEKQLISIARAVLADPAIFLLDEATSSVDTAAEKLIQQAVEYLMEGRTSIIIAHRLSTVQSVDRIILIEDGRILEDGNHEELMALRGRYWDLCRNQFLRGGEDR